MYKRQGQDEGDSCHDVLSARAREKGLAGPSRCTLPVSYTHLDEALFVPIDDIDILNNTKDRTEDAIPR